MTDPIKPICTINLKSDANSLDASKLRHCLEQSVLASKAMSLHQPWQKVRIEFAGTVLYESEEEFPITSLATLLFEYSIIV